MGKVVSILQQKHRQKFPFSELPDVCKIHILSFLTIDERVSAARVCTEWRHLLSSPALWTDVDVPASVKVRKTSLHSPAKHQEPLSSTCVRKYLDFISKVDPSIRRFVFVGDIIDTGCYDALQSFIGKCRLAELQHVSINWSHTGAAKSPIVAVRDSAAHSPVVWQVDENHRRRQRLFVHLFVELCSAAPNITSLALPFDWSPKSVKAISCLSKLESLSLSRYSDLQCLDCVTLNRIITSLPKLQRLLLEVWVPCATGGLTYYSLCSKSLEYVDLSQCRGVAIGHADLRRVKVMKLSRCRWSGPLSVDSTADTYYLPCLHRVLRDGVPNLVELNGHLLQTGWRNAVYSELDSILKSVCPCDLHCGWTTAAIDCF